MKIQDIVADVVACWNTDKEWTLCELLVALHNNMNTRNIKIRMGCGLFPIITKDPEIAMFVYEQANDFELTRKINGINFDGNILYVMI